jgi:hypothetical protein
MRLWHEVHRRVERGGIRSSKAGKGPFDIRVGQVGERTRCFVGDCRQTFRRIAVMALNVQLNQGIEGGPLVRSQRALFHEYLAERFAFIENPGVHRGDQRFARDEIHLERENAEEQVAVCAPLAMRGVGHRTYLARSGQCRHVVENDDYRPRFKRLQSPGWRPRGHAFRSLDLR